MADASTKRTVGILICDGVELLDFAGPFEVFAIAYESDGDTAIGASSQRHVLTIAPDAGPITTFGGLQVQPHYTLANHPPLDILIVPGGGGVRRLAGDRRVLDWIIREEREVEILASVCTGAFLLAEAGILDDRPATTHWEYIESLQDRYPRIDVQADRRIVDLGHVVTSAGISAGIDMAIHLIARLHGPEAGANLARAMEYDWTPVQDMSPA